MKFGKTWKATMDYTKSAILGTSAKDVKMVRLRVLKVHLIQAYINPSAFL